VSGTPRTHHADIVRTWLKFEVISAIAIGLLIEDNTVLDNGNQLGYDTKIKDILPDWQLQDTYMRDHLDLVDLLGSSLFQQRNPTLMTSNAKWITQT